jgi:isocitrate/isopropylmalate dehydrogenase
LHSFEGVVVHAYDTVLPGDGIAPNICEYALKLGEVQSRDDGSRDIQSFSSKAVIVVIRENTVELYSGIEHYSRAERGRLTGAERNAIGGRVED